MTKRNTLVATLFILGAASTLGTARAEIAGTNPVNPVSASATELTQVALGWSVKKSLIDKVVYGDAGEKIGVVSDVIIAPDKRSSYLIVGPNGLVGVGGHDVAVPAAQVQSNWGKLVMPGATRELLKSLPPFDYTNDTANRYRFVTTAELDVARAKLKVRNLDKKSAAAAPDSKLQLDRQIAGLQRDLKIAEEKLAEMKKAVATRWKELEGDVSSATARLRNAP